MVLVKQLDSVVSEKRRSGKVVKKVDCDDDASHALNNSVTNTVKIVALK